MRTPNTGLRQPPERSLLAPAERRVRLLAWRGVRVVLDVGANAGQFALRLRDAGFDGRIVSYEPGQSAFARLDENARGDQSWECHRLALGDRDGDAILNVAGDSEGSSLLQVMDREVQNSPGSAFVGTERVRVARIDSVLSGLGLDAERIYLKIDTQGSELAILRGAPDALRRAELIEERGVRLAHLGAGGQVATRPGIPDAVRRRTKRVRIG